MDSNILLHTDRRFKAADADGILDSNTRGMYRDFKAWKNSYEEARKKHENARTLIENGALSVKLDLNEARRSMNVAETRLTTLSQDIAKSILALRKDNRCIHRINYQPVA